MVQNKPIHIFLADDDDDDTFLFREALDQIQVPVKLDVAESGVELMHILHSNGAIPDVIFLDMNMPVKNGLECLHEIRNSDSLKQIPVVILSTSIAKYLLESAHKGGANLYIQKPTSFIDLVTVLKNCLSKTRDFEQTLGLDEFLIKNDHN